MSTKKPNVKIENGKVIFSQEILDYFESLRNKETSEWIDKYFEVLSDSSNINSEKFNIHHIKPCFTFKDEIHKTRKQTEHLADEFNENKIKLSIKNHLIIHYYLWKIFNNKESKKAFYQMFNININELNNLTESELIKIAEMIEECKKKNRTEKEKEEYTQKYNKNYYNKNIDKLLKNSRDYYHSHVGESNKRSKEYRKKNSEKIKNQKHNYYLEHIEEEHSRSKQYKENNPEKIKQINHDYYYQHQDEISKQKKDYYLKKL